MTRNGFAAALLLGAALALGGAADRQRIVGGATAGDAAVVQMVVDGALRCSGSLIGPSTVLTAAHCAVPVGQESSVTVQVEPAGDAGRVGLEIEAQYANPQWTYGKRGHDQLLLRLKRPVPEVEPLSLYSGTFTREDVGRDLRVLGFGSTQGSPALGAGVRRDVVLVIRQVLPLELEAGAAGRHACAGDSGGPALLRAEADGREYLAATVSQGDRQCVGSGFFSRVDVDAPWIVSTASAWDSVAVGPATSDGGSPGSCAGAGPGELLGALLGLRSRRGRRLAPRSEVELR
ncbi:MAG: trypsin-like serine protease [Myxococcales bacterium]